MSGRITHYKIVLLGDTAVGKSCLVVRFVRNEFSETEQPTIGAAFLTQTVHVDDNVLKLEIWDTAGQERFRALAPMYYRGAQAALVVFDITQRDTLDGAKSWIEELKRRADPNVIVALVANKCDLEEKRVVSREEAMEFAESQGLLYGETSAKSGEGVREMFQRIAEKLPELSSVASNRQSLPAPSSSDGCC